MPALNALAAAGYAGATLGEAIHIVHVYVIDPHPQGPDPGPYLGSVSEARYSTKRQPRTYDERVACARDVRPEILGPQIQVIDDLTPGSRNNPVWCTYGTCPNCAFLIRRDGTIDTVQTWFDGPAMERAVRALLARPSAS